MKTNPRGEPGGCDLIVMAWIGIVLSGITVIVVHFWNQIMNWIVYGQ